MQLYYRHGEKNVSVFRVEVANRQRGIELNKIATIRPDGTILPHPRRTPTDAEMAEIGRWWADWQSRLSAGDLGHTEEFIADLNRFTDWMARKADGGEVDAQSDALLSALLDLRQTVVRRLSQIEPDDD